jgi:hypothetical protein
MEAHMHHHTDPALHECIELCWSCRDTCQSMLFNHCLIEGGPHLAPDHVRLMADCVQICQTSADFMTRNSAMHAHTCAACAKVCDACAESCEALGDEDMRRCAEMCRRCADSCRLMSGSH